MKRDPGCFTLAAAAAMVLFPSACSDSIAAPAQLGDCIATRDAGCKSAVGGGGGSLSPGDAGTGLDAGAGLDAAPVAPSPDASSCGQADVLISSTTQNATCLPCILAAPASGSLNCCMSDANCSGDPGCVALLQCALPCNGNSVCVETCEMQLLSTQQSVQYYIAFGSCLAQHCPQCPPLPQGTASDI